MSNSVKILFSEEVVQKLKSFPPEKYQILKALLLEKITLLEKYPKIGTLTENPKFRRFIIEINKYQIYKFYYHFDEVNNEIFITFFQHSKENPMM